MAQLSPEEFLCQCQSWVEASDRLADGWRLEERGQGVVLRRTGVMLIEGEVVGDREEGEVTENKLQVGCEHEVTYGAA